MKNEKPDPASQVKWSALLKAIRDEKCILCIGPGVFTNRAGASLDDQVNAKLKGDAEIDKDVVVYPDGLFHFRKKNKRNDVLADLDSFYTGSFPEAERIFKKLVQIPFNLVVFLTPDNKFHEISIAENRPYLKDVYRKDKPPVVDAKPTKEAPLVYHLLGGLKAEADEALVLTYDDLFVFLKSILEGGPISEEVNSTIINARHFVCLGLPFEKWYMQLLLRVLGLHVNEESTKYVSVSGEEAKIIEIYKDQFNLMVIPSGVEHFVDTLLEKCTQDQLIREEKVQKDPQVSPQVSPVVNIQKLIADNQVDQALDLLETTLKEQGKWEKNDSQYFGHRGQFKMLNTQLNHEFIPLEEYNRGMAKLRTAILDFAKTELR